MNIEFTKEDLLKAEAMIAERLDILMKDYDCNICGETFRGGDVVEHMRKLHMKKMLSILTKVASNDIPNRQN